MSASAAEAKRSCSLVIAEYIVVFKQGVTKDQIQKHVEQVNQNGA